MNCGVTCLLWHVGLLCVYIVSLWARGAAKRRQDRRVYERWCKAMERAGLWDKETPSR